MFGLLLVWSRSMNALMMRYELRKQIVNSHWTFNHLNQKHECGWNGQKNYRALTNDGK